jgi:amidase
VTTFIERSAIGRGGPRVAVKDVIDVAGLPTTGGCRALAAEAAPSASDAACLRGLRVAVDAGVAQIVGKANLDELAAGCVGMNPWFGAAVNPLDPGLVAGGSSSGSAVAVATGEADIGIGTDTGGSIRIPAACCGVVGLKTTHGRLPTDGVVPFSQTFDVIGPIARGLAGVIEGMALLEPGFKPAPDPARVVGRVRVPGVDPAIDAAIDRALRDAGLELVEVELPGWATARAAALAIGLPEGWRNHGAMVEQEPENVGEVAAATVLEGRGLQRSEAQARSRQRLWLAELERAFEEVDLLASPTLAGFPSRLEQAETFFELARTIEMNLAGVPALAQPVPVAGPVPASLQLWGQHHSEGLLVATGALVETALA